MKKSELQMLQPLAAPVRIFMVTQAGNPKKPLKDKK
jgi:hypothetical protein